MSMLLIGLFFGSLIPGISLICIIGITMFIGSIRIMLLRVASYKTQASWELPYALANALPLCIFFYCVLNAIFYRNIQGEFSKTTIISIVISGANIIFPARTILRIF